MGDTARRVGAEPGGPKHDFWVVPYADMVTLLFALFVVLYSIGEVRIRKLAELRRAFALALGTETQSDARDGSIDAGSFTDGDLVDGLELINAQPGPMRQFLLETLPDRFEEIAGRSLEIVVTDDTVAFEAPLSALWAPGEVTPREDFQVWLLDVFEGISAYGSETRIRIAAPDVVVSRDADGRAVRSEELCVRRLTRLRALLRVLPQVESRTIITEFRPKGPVSGSWEADATITFAFATP
ncbi:MAG: hypothetical protein HZB39_18040 [Planctomycetes bacterium]|nr:hypothetical protein [Planctomycetota bacterium]